MSQGGSAFDLENEEEICDLADWQLPLAFNEKRHTEKIEGDPPAEQTWRMKERMKTVSVGLVLCLNVGVDPPDIVKTQPCARQECWIDPATMPPIRALQCIGDSLQAQYERWQPRARVKANLDPTVEDVKKLCVNLRKTSREERVLFHYNGHGVPKPTTNGEIWVFNRSYTQYIPLSIYDLQQWMGTPSIYVYDCSCAGLIVESFKQFAAQREHEYAAESNQNQFQGPPPNYKSCIQLAACSSNEILPMNPDLPADLFTSCLTTPIKIALRWYVMQNTNKLVPGITVEHLEKIPGQLNDRRTMLGELNWIFTAITDTIAWNVLPKDLFQRLFRQDLLVASLFRNFLLAERIMRSFNCNPVSHPELPSTYQHPMWQAWDLTVDLCLAQLPAILEERATFRHSNFFTEQLTAFQVWLQFGNESLSAPEQLPIVLQVLLSQVHRLRALELLSRFLDFGPRTVNLALSVGIFPYVLKLLQSSARELRPLLVFVWAKVMAFDESCQVDVVRDGGYKYFLHILADPYMPPDHRAMAAFIMSCVVHNYPAGQEAAMQGNLIALCLEQLTDPNEHLRQWLAICLGRTWENYDDAKWYGVRDSAHEKLFTLLTDSFPEVRAAAVFALGTFIISSSNRSDHANSIDHSIGMMLINTVANDGSPIVRKELVVALQWLVLAFENQFTAVAFQMMEEGRLRDSPSNHLVVQDNTSPTGSMRKVASRDRLKILNSSGIGHWFGGGENQENLSLSHSDALGVPSADRMKRVSSTTSLCSMNSGSPILSGFGSVYTSIWKAILVLGNDSHPEVAGLARVLIHSVKCKVHGSGMLDTSKNHKMLMSSSSSSISEPSSPSGKPTFLMGDSPPANVQSQELSRTSTPNRPSEPRQPFQQYQYSAQFTRTRKLFDKGPTPPIMENSEESNTSKKPLITSQFVEWSCRHFKQPVIKFPSESDPESQVYLEREWRFLRNAWMRKTVQEEYKRPDVGRTAEQVFLNKNPGAPKALKLHPYEPHLVVADKEAFSIWDWEQNILYCTHSNGNPSHTRITSVDFLNYHNNALLMVGSDDGAVRVWQNYFHESNKERELITAFHMFTDRMSSQRGSGLILEWEQQTCQIIASGDVRVIRIWDAEKEMKVQDILTGSESCITSLSADTYGQSLFVAGCGDGAVRLFDKRLPPTESQVRTWREHAGWVINVHMNKGAEKSGRIVSGSIAGEVRVWDVRLSSSIRNFQTSQGGMTAMAVHPEADLVACGSANQHISVCNVLGEVLNVIKCYDRFMNKGLGPIACLEYHPLHVTLAVGSTDSQVSVFSAEKQR